MSRTLLLQLSEFVADLKFEDLPIEVISKANDAVFDLIGCYFGALGQKDCRAILNYAGQHRDPAQAILWGTSHKIPASEAAMVEGFLAYSLEFDDGVSLGGHWGSSSIPAVIATAERLGKSGKDVILGIVCAYEVGTRISRLYAPNLLAHKIHFPCAMGAFAAAGGVAKVSGYSAGIIEGGLANGCLSPIGPYSTAVSGASIKNMYSGWPNTMGMKMMEFAEMGLYGDSDTFESDNGLGMAYGKEPLTEELKASALKSLGTKYMLMESYFKPYPCCRWLHAPLDVLHRIMVRNSGRTIESITVAGPEFIHLYDTKLPYNDKIKAQYSIPFTLGAMLLTGEVGLSAFDTEFRTSMAVGEASGRISIFTDAELNLAFPNSFSVRLDVYFNDGGRDTLIGGLPWNPTQPATKLELIAKFKTLVNGVLPKAEIEEWIYLFLNGLERETTFIQILELLHREHVIGSRN
ncbi:MAG: hypothetical protein CVV46_15725 [Spirochaetae bacterium HGW-Spirochaetae-2]|nr:MAG: hypothetical protein CVV46_15725 [Spirochaetae bacterium HGW-Spirochaetae-2]